MRKLQLRQTLFKFQIVFLFSKKFFFLKKKYTFVFKNCKEESLATLYCETCVRNYLKMFYSNWTSGSDDADHLIQKCQMETLTPYNIVEWIPYDNLENIKYLTKGGYSEIYSADWID